MHQEQPTEPLAKLHNTNRLRLMRVLEIWRLLQEGMSEAEVLKLYYGVATPRKVKEWVRAARGLGPEDVARLERLVQAR
jgi:tRNA A37 N6-isopentenylltransferase MiaA